MSKLLPNQFIIEGVDRMGKSTLIKGLMDTLGYHLKIHYEKPQKLAYYTSQTDEPLKLYQTVLYRQMFDLIDAGHRIIFDRGHLGEMVYAPMYRKYDGDYVLDYETQVDTSHTRLVLLTTSDFSFIQDDGLSIDFSKKEEEQDKFVYAFKRSNIADKVLVDVSNGTGGYRSAESILAEVLKNSVL